MPNQFEDYLFDLSRSIEPKDQPVKKMVSCYSDKLHPHYIDIEFAIATSPTHSYKRLICNFNTNEFIAKEIQI